MVNVTTVRFQPAHRLPGKAQANINAGTFVVVKGSEGPTPLIDVATAGALPLGVVAHDVQSGGIVAVIRGGVLEVQSAGIIAAGAPVSVGANGAAVAAAVDAPVVGVAVQAAASNRVFVALN